MEAVTPHRAFRFIHPDLDQDGGSPETSGLQLGRNGGLAMVSGDEAVRQSVLLLLTTRPGERVMRPAYGCNLHTLVFAPNDDTTAAIAIYHIRQAIEQWEPRVDILDLDASPGRDRENTLVIFLKYQVRTTQQTEEVRIVFDLSGGGD